jgi:hypothetical protein
VLDLPSRAIAAIAWHRVRPRKIAREACVLLESQGW